MAIIQVKLSAEGSPYLVSQYTGTGDTSGGLWDASQITPASGDQLEVTEAVTGGSGDETVTVLDSNGQIEVNNVEAAPAFTLTRPVSATDSTITVGLTCDQNCTVYGVIVADGTKTNATNPDAADNVRAGLAPDGTSPIQAVSGAATATVERLLIFNAGLTGDTMYDVYVTLDYGDLLQIAVEDYDASGSGWQGAGTFEINVASDDSYTPTKLDVSTTGTLVSVSGSRRTYTPNNSLGKIGRR